jgi:hypothetical protein
MVSSHPTQWTIQGIGYGRLNLSLACTVYANASIPCAAAMLLLYAVCGTRSACTASMSTLVAIVYLASLVLGVVCGIALLVRLVESR